MKYHKVWFIRTPDDKNWQKESLAKFANLKDYLKTVDISKNKNMDITNKPFYIEVYSASWTWIVRVDPNEAITDRNKLLGLITAIDKSVTNNKLIMEWNPWSKWSFLKLSTTNNLSQELKTYNDLISPYEWKSFNNIKKELQSKANKTKQDLHLLSFISDFEWDYKMASNYRNDLCNLNKDYCATKVTVNIEWKVVDAKDRPVKDAVVTLLNDATYKATTDSNWIYKLSFKSFPMSRIRTHASAKDLSDWFNAITVLYDLPTTQDFKANNFTLQIPEKTVSLKIKDSNDWTYIFESSQTVYKVPIKSIVHADWTPYKWEVLAYLYEFNKNTNMQNYMNNDTFDSVYGYVWNIMKTFWMKYLQLFTPDWKEELHIRKTSPALITQKIYHMKELYEWSDHIYAPITDKDMKFLVDKSKELWWYPINREFLISNNLLRWPAHWTLNRTKWTWENIWVRVTDINWVIEAQYYTID